MRTRAAETKRRVDHEVRNVDDKDDEEEEENKDVEE